MENYLPVLILLKEMKEFFYDPSVNSNSNVTAEKILSWYFKFKMDSVINLELVEQYIEAGKIIFLLDGLDEVLPEHRDVIVNAFANLRIKQNDNRVVFTSRPHGIQGAAINRLSENHVKLLTLNMDQVKEFIGKWFMYLYSGSLGSGKKSADGMIGEITDHPAVEKLIDNPLMLTAICILYYDDKELPGQRAELYKKFIDNLLYRRFDDPEIVHEYLKTLAFRMHAQTIRTADRDLAVGILKEVSKKNMEEDEHEYDKRMQNTFDDIELKCGLLKFENGEYNFWHLTFQEFLTADYIVDNSSNYIEAVELYWNDDWYKEVIELYIGYLSIDNRKWANDIVDTALNTDDTVPYKRWRLASRSLLDIHKDRRYDHVTERAKARMLEAINKLQEEPKILADAGEILGWLGDPRDMMEFIKVEGGEYELKDIGKVTVKPFEICRYPVTNNWFEKFIKEGGYENKDFWSDEGKKWLKRSSAKQPRLWDDRKWRCPNSLVVGVCWYEAYAYTSWLTQFWSDGYTYRLLSEKEWQAAAAGKNGREYPWGDEWAENKCNKYKTGIDKTTPAGI
ncbi:MAG: SUMF1/EgtB/PvdO family nonheme iron enzyme, partial [Spirochaetota bacterium]|nr:SUMF1/EgtB/PvdO family nonheme iron enzyme [Spirochaetota bacterium]